MMFSSLSVIVLLASFAGSAYSHGLVTAVNGANGVNGVGFGVDPSTPRDGSRAKPFQQDTSIIRDREIQSGKADACGRTKIGGNVNIQTEMSNAVANGLPECDANGQVTMTVHQVNQDGAGPFNCDVDPTGTGDPNSFVQMNIVQDVPGKDVPIIGSLSGAKATDFQLVAQMPQGMTCSGAGGACLVRCRNNAIAGPFGSCAAVAMAGSSGSTGSNSTTAVSGNAGAGSTGAASGNTGTGSTGAASGTSGNGSAGSASGNSGTGSAGASSSGGGAKNSGTTTKSSSGSFGANLASILKARADVDVVVEDDDWAIIKQALASIDRKRSMRRMRRSSGARRH